MHLAHVASGSDVGPGLASPHGLGPLAFLLLLALLAVVWSAVLFALLRALARSSAPRRDA
jgi:hypothetical protein